MRGLFLAVLLACSAGAEEQSFKAAFDAGCLAEAIELAQEGDTAQDHIHAAQALLAVCLMNKSRCAASQNAEKAEAHALAASNLEPANQEARLALAVSISLRLQALSTREARRTGEIRQPKKIAEALLNENPQDAYAHLVLSLWHIEVVKRGGRVGAMFMGASIRKAQEHYRAAIAIQPSDPVIHWEYARAMALVESSRLEDEIQKALDLCAELEGSIALETERVKHCNIVGRLLKLEGLRSLRDNIDLMESLPCSTCCQSAK